MGTLFKQEPRDYLRVKESEVIDLIKSAKKIAKEEKVDGSICN